MNANTTIGITALSEWNEIVLECDNLTIATPTWL